MVIVPATESMGPVFSSWTGPTKLRSTVDGDGPKYEISTVAPTDGGAGNTSHPGPAPLGPGPGPCAVLGSPAVALGVMFALRMSILPSNALRGVRSGGELCASADMPNVITIAEAMTTLETPRLLEALRIIFDTLLDSSSWAPIRRYNLREVPPTASLFASPAGKLRGPKSAFEMS